jgi:hypothetical protein
MGGESKAKIQVYIVIVLACSFSNVASVTCSATSQAVVSEELEIV